MNSLSYIQKDVTPVNIEKIDDSDFKGDEREVQTSLEMPQIEEAPDKENVKFTNKQQDSFQKTDHPKEDIFKLFTSAKDEPSIIQNKSDLSAIIFLSMEQDEENVLEKNRQMKKKSYGNEAKIFH